MILTCAYDVLTVLDSNFNRQQHIGIIARQIVHIILISSLALDLQVLLNEHFDVFLCNLRIIRTYEVTDLNLVCGYVILRSNQKLRALRLTLSH